MFEVKHLIGSTCYFEAFTNVGIYRLDESKVVLIDACEHKRMAKAVNNYLKAENLTVDTVICTHCHVDHICGNKIFQDKYGCRILSSEKEVPFILQPDLESCFYYAGIDTDKTRNPFFMGEPSYPEAVTEENLPQGLEIIRLPGHSFDMIGVKTSDNVFFIGDSILSEKTWTEFKVPFFRDVNKSIETLHMLKEIKAEIFVPSHNEPLTDITALAELNISKLKELKETAYSLCNGIGFDDFFTAFAETLSLKIRTEKYASYATMLKNVLQSLIEDEKIKSVVENNKFLYFRK